MKTVRSVGFPAVLLLLALAFLFLHFEGAGAQEGDVAAQQIQIPYRGFDPAVTAVGGTGLFTPHGVADESNRIRIVYSSDAPGAYYTYSSAPGNAFSSPVAVAEGEYRNTRMDVDMLERAYVLYSYRSGVGYYPALFREDNGIFSTDPPDFDLVEANFDGRTSHVHGDVSAEGQYVYITIEDDGDVIKFSHSADWGDVFNLPENISAQAGARFPAIAYAGEGDDRAVCIAYVADGTLYVMQNEDPHNNNPGGFSQTYKSPDHGVPDYRPGIAAFGDKVFVVWSQNGNVYFNYSDDRGASFQADPVPIAEDVEVDSQPSIGARSEEHIYVAWRQREEDSPRIYFQEAMWQGDLGDEEWVWGIDQDANEVILLDEEGAVLRVAEDSQGVERFPSVAVSPHGAVYVTWLDDVAGIRSARYPKDLLWRDPEPEEVGAPEPPDDLRVDGVPGVSGSSGFELSWNYYKEDPENPLEQVYLSTDISYFRVYRAIGRGDYVQIADLLSEEDAGRFVYTDYFDSLGQTVWYVATAVDTQGNESEFSNEVNATPNVDRDVYPKPPGNPSADGLDEAVYLTWDAVTHAVNDDPVDIARYNVYYRTEEEFNAGEPFRFAGSSEAEWFVHPGRTNDVLYQYAVTAVRQGGGESADSDYVTARPVSMPEVAPAPPGDLRVEGVTASSVELEWDESDTPGVVRYDIYRARDRGDYVLHGTVGGHVTGYTDTREIVSGRTYWYAVRAVDYAGLQSDYSNEVSATPGIDIGLYPKAPAGLDAEALNEAVYLTWDAVTHAVNDDPVDIARYNVYYRTEEEVFAGAPFRLAGSSEAEWFFHSGLTNGRMYEYAVTAVRQGGGESADSDRVQAVPVFMPEVAPAPPGNLRVEGVTASSVELEWDESDTPGVVRYDIYRARDRGGYVLHGTVGGHLSEYTDTREIVSGRTYWYAVRAVDHLGVESVFSNEVNATPGAGFPPPEAPENLTAHPLNEAVYLRWDDNVDDAASYNVYYRTESDIIAGAPFRLAGNAEAEWFVHFGLTNNVIYQYVVTAVRLDGGESADSNMVQAIPFDYEPEPPLAPENLTISGVGDNFVELSWDEVPTPLNRPPVFYYHIYRVPETGRGNYELLDTVEWNETYYFDGSAANGTIYWYVVTAEKWSGDESFYSNEVNATPQIVGAKLYPERLPPPQDFRAFPRAGAVFLTWTPEDQAERYRIYRRNVGAEGSPYFFVTGGELLAPAHQFLDTTARNGVKYAYVITSIDSEKAESADSLSAMATPFEGEPEEIPDAPAYLRVKEVGDREITLEWGESPTPDVLFYHIYRAEGPGGRGTGYERIFSASALSEREFTDKNLTNGTTYWYAAKAEMPCGGLSEFSNDVNATPQLATVSTVRPKAPENLDAVGRDEMVRLRWDPVSRNMNDETVQIVRYYVYFRISSEDMYELAGGVPAHENYYEHRNLANGVSYEYVVTAVDIRNNESEDSASAKATPGRVEWEEGAPEPPVLTRVEAGNATVRLEWSESPSPDAVLYRVYRGEVRGEWTQIAEVSYLEYRDNAVVNGTIYWYAVTAVDVEGYESIFSNSLNATPQAPGVPDVKPLAPLLRAPSAGDSRVDLGWYAVAEAVMYHVYYRRQDQGAPFTLVEAVPASSQPEYRHTGLTNNVTYEYVVTAVDQHNNESEDSNVQPATPRRPEWIPGGPMPPTNLEVVGSGNRRVELEWNPSVSGDVSFYRVYRSTTRGDWTAAGVIAETFDPDYTDNNVNNRTIYWYAVTAVDVEGYESIFSNSVNATPQPDGVDSTPPAAPENLRIVPGDQMLILQWDPNAEDDLHRYHIYRRRDPGDPFAFVDEVLEPWAFYYDTGLINGIAYEYVVTAIDIYNNESADSDSRIGIPGDPDYAPGGPRPPSDVITEAGHAAAQFEPEGFPTVTVRWNPSPSPDVRFYRVYRAGVRGDWTRGSGWLATNITDTRYRDDEVEFSTIYWYVVTAVDSEGRESLFSNSVNATPQPPGADDVPPARPENLRATPSDRTVSLRWNANTEDDLAGYMVYARTSVNEPLSFVARIESGAGQAQRASFYHTNLTDGVRYEYVVTAFDTSNNESADSDAVYAVPGTGEYGQPGPAPAPPPAPDGTGPPAGAPSGGCFVATAVYGSALSREVGVLSAMRDNYLMESSYGRKFVNVYYRLSPAVSGIASRNRALRFLARLHIGPVVRAAGWVSE